MLLPDYIYVNFFLNKVASYTLLDETRQDLNHKIDDLHLP